jgi:hypothetical protein
MHNASITATPSPFHCLHNYDHYLPFYEVSDTLSQEFFSYIFLGQLTPIILGCEDTILGPQVRLYSPSV